MMPPSQSEGTTSRTTEMEPTERPLMPADLYRAVIEGDRDVLVQCLGLADEEPNDVTIQIDSAPQQSATKEQTSESDLQSVTRFGNTILHLLVANKQHNDLAVKVFQNDPTLLTAQNKELVTPLHTAAKYGNWEVIANLHWRDPDLVKNVVKKTNDNGNTALHVAAKHGQKEVVRQLMEIDLKMAYEFNKEGFSPLHLAIANASDEIMLIPIDDESPAYDKFIDVVRIILEVDPSAAWTEFADGTLPIHVAARMGKTEIVQLFMSNNWEVASLPDPDGRNLFHIAAANNKDDVIWQADSALRNLDRGNEHFKEVINAKDCKGNTPLHIAAMMGNNNVVSTLQWFEVDESRRNNKGRTPFQISAADRFEKSTPRQRFKMRDYIKRHGKVFTKEWFDLDKELAPQVIAERTQVIGLGSVLITTIAFAAAFTFPGGYNSDNGTPILGRRYMFRAFMVANALAFVQSFASIFLLIKSYFWSGDQYYSDPQESINSAALLFLSSATSMVKAFGIGSYVMLAPVNLPIAIIILILGMLFGSSTVISLFGPLSMHLSEWFPGGEYFPYYGNWREDLCDFFSEMASDLIRLAVLRSWPILIIFGIAFLK